ncbi:MAG: hypothetical protein F2667_04210 [Actinobacteria bacterium]|uniref:Unannotated protein n=1 Tax=freshwater metagenome TaxID=449393 RepID=A0A6J6PIJ8_9ZZZZ|nr:hypothetical protein [Actinomycetota bacterium]
MPRRLLTAALVLLTAGGLSAGHAGAVPAAEVSASARASTPVPLPTLSTPPDGIHGHPLWDSWHDLAPFGYTEEEFLVSGTARADDGTTTAPYTTRVIVFRPERRADFNGTVLLDWVNVTAQFENAVDTLEAREMLLREGFAFVHVSAQAAGLCCTPLTPQIYDPVRYAAIEHPGDEFAASMFSQIALAMRTPVVRGVRPMGDLRVRRVLAAGQSQSASRLYAYVNGAQGGAGVIDGFLIHGGGDLDYPQALRVPVLQLNSDLAESTGTPDTDRRYRLWEVAGAAHSDLFIGYQSVVGNGGRVAGLPAMDRAGYDASIEAAGNYGQVLSPLLGTCTVAGAAMPTHYAVSTALHQLNRWVITGRAPAVMPRFEYDADGVTPLRDADRNVLGGIRLPPIQVPVASYESTLCQLGGITVPFTDVEIQSRYPTFDDYQARMAQATDLAVRRGWLLPVDAVDMMRRVCSAQGRYVTGDQGTCRDYAPPRFAVRR